MPSMLIGAQSGGVPLISGNPWSGPPLLQPIRGVQLRASNEVSGNIYVSWSGGVTIKSGGGLSSGGIMDGMELGAGDRYDMRLPPGGPASLFATCVSTISGTIRLFYNPF